MLAHSQNKKFIIYFQSAISPISICVLLLPNFKTELFFQDQERKAKRQLLGRIQKIPNPHSAKLQFYNAIMKDICKSGAEKTYRGDFQQYLIDQRQYKWVVHSNIIHLQSRHQQLLVDKETKDGWEKNVQRLKSFPSNPKQADIAKATGALKALLKLEEALTTVEENLSKRLGLLYDKNNIIKPGAENESAFHKNNLIIIKKMKQEVNIVIGNLNYT